MTKAKTKRTSFERVREFHEVFRHPVETSPVTPDVKGIKLRINLILEEAGELINAIGGSQPGNQRLQRAADHLVRAMHQVDEAPTYEFRHLDIVGVADALGDIDYVTQGAGHAFGIDMDKLGEEIHRSNMTKLGPDGEPIYHPGTGKVLKPDTYEKPNIAGVLGLAQEKVEEPVE